MFQVNLVALDKHPISHFIKVTAYYYVEMQSLEWNFKFDNNCRNCDLIIGVE